MTANEVLNLIPALTAGILLGALFFGGLWWTIRKALGSFAPGLWFSGSLLLRTGVALAGFYFVSGGNWKRLIACLVGFGMARLMVSRYTRSGTSELRRLDGTKQTQAAHNAA